jgi:hypothetical protein
MELPERPFKSPERFMGDNLPFGGDNLSQIEDNI